MPTNVELFDMLEPGILAGMTKEQLLNELDRALRMRVAVFNYHNDAVRALDNLYPEESRFLNLSNESK